MIEKHEPASAVMYQAIPRLAGDTASGRVEDAIFLIKKLHKVQLFYQKEV
jgi:hypothetical protein